MDRARSPRFRHFAVLSAVAINLGCAPDLRSEFPFDGELPDGVYLTHEDREDGTTLTRVDASERESWVYFDMDERKQLTAEEAIAPGASWDVAFQRFKVISNSGVSGSGSVEVAVLEGESLDALTVAPATGYLVDAPDANDDADQDIDSPFLVQGAWYAYDLIKHRLVARPMLYVVRSTAGRYWAMRFLGYYDQAGTAAHPSFEWKELPAPSP